MHRLCLRSRGGFENFHIDSLSRLRWKPVSEIQKAALWLSELAQTMQSVISMYNVIPKKPDTSMSGTPGARTRGLKSWKSSKSWDLRQLWRWFVALVWSIYQYSVVPRCTLELCEGSGWSEFRAGWLNHSYRVQCSHKNGFCYLELYAQTRVSCWHLGSIPDSQVILGIEWKCDSVTEGRYWRC